MKKKKVSQDYDLTGLRVEKSLVFYWLRKEGNIIDRFINNPPSRVSKYNHEKYIRDEIRINRWRNSL